jgi:hypothetical protein
MIDRLTHERMQVRTEGLAGSYLAVEDGQLPAVEQALQAAGIAYAVVPEAISVDDEPFVSVVNLGLGADVVRVQAALDAAPDEDPAHAAD